MAISTYPFGRTGHLSSRTLFGAAALSRVTQQEADQTLDLLLTYGVNHIDTAASYGDAELRIGPWMDRGLREHFFLATKTENRTFQGAKDELHRSLERMRVNSVDLWQMHILVDPKEWQTAMGPSGALEAFIEARQQGLVRFLGVTGHGVTIAEMHRRSLERFDFDSVLLPYNYPMMQNQNYAAEFEQLVGLCREQQVAIQTIKSITKGPWGSKSPDRATWYEPLEDPAAIEAAVHWVLARERFFLNTVGDIHILPHVLAAAESFDEGISQETAEAKLTTLGLTPLFV